MDTATFQRFLSGLLLVTFFLPPVKTSSSSFSTTLSNNVYLNASGFLNISQIWQLKSNSGLSFRTCSNGKLLHQVGATGNSLTLTLNNGVLNLEWQINSSLSNVTVGENLNDNAWYFVKFEFLLGNLSIIVQKGPDILFTKLIANDSFNQNLWNVKLQNGSALLVGFNFTGCLMSGPNIDLTSASSTGFVYNGCPSTYNTNCSETKVDVNDCYSYPCQNGGTCVDQDQDYKCTCLPTFTGRNCDLNLGDQKCALMPCLNNGTCVNTTNSFVCNCLPGFTGMYCNLNINECETKPCTYGNCIDGINSFTCNCTGTGYKGQTCSENVDECKELVRPCNGSKCVDTFGSYTCQCEEGYAGPMCEEINECLSGPCQNGGTCTDSVNKYTCACIKGFTGDKCETNIFDCSASSCPWNNTICKDRINNFTCECKPGFNGSVEDCKDINECDSDPCKNNATCINLENKFQCDCILGFNGNTCDNNIDDCEPSPCQNNATCLDGINNYTCKCAGGFKDRNCSTNIDDCADKPCKNGGVCIDLIQNYKCNCAPGWTGVNCSKDFDECSLGLCQNGAQCKNLLNDYNCSCVPGYEGKNCSIDINDCLINPCQNGGKCKDLVNDYFCNCTSEWMGKNCSEEYDACSFKPCQNNATCSSLKRFRDYNCSCVLGFDGVNCENNIDDCKNVTCENGTVCFDEINSYHCACPIGMKGNNCSEDINECEKKPCQHNGKCLNSIGSYKCECDFKIETIENNVHLKYPTGYNGTNCENDINECNYIFPGENHGICLNGGHCTNRQGSFLCTCDNSGSEGKYTVGRNCELFFDYCTNSTGRCQNGGTCKSDPKEKFVCSCKVGFTGKNCEINIDDCVNNPCQNNGTCEDGINSYNCSCINGTEGKNCEIDINECESNPCKNFGQCKDLLNRYQCNCTDTGFTGPTCSKNIDDCLSNPCQNNASCIDGVKNYTCKCYKGYKSEHCETDINECSINPCVHSYACLQRSNQSLYGQNPPYFDSPQFSYANASGYKCLCETGYEGHNCSQDINECLSLNCVHGNCSDYIGFAKCDCDEGYEGKLCNTDIDECSRSYCQHGSKCYNGEGVYNCTCLKGPSKPWYGGKNCSIELTACNHNSCFNNGTCNPFFDENNSQHYYTCSCLPGFKGKDCQVLTTMSFNGSSFLETKALATNKLIIEFQYQTTLGNILVSTFVLQNNKYLTFQLRQGQPALVNDNITNLNFDTVNNSAWQFIKFEFNSKELLVQIGGSLKKFELTEETTGEVSFGKLHSNLSPNFKHSSAPFIGCLQDVSVNGNILLATNASKVEHVTMSCPRRDQCLSDSCNKRGGCIDLWFQRQCICDRPYIGDTCQGEVTAGTFAFNMTLSFSEYNLTTIQDQLQSNLELSFYFITRYSDGQVAYFSDSDQTGSTSGSFFSLRLQDGNIVTELKRCKDFIYKTPTKYDDGRKHFLEVKVFLENITLVVDSFNITKNLDDRCVLNTSILTVGKKPDSPSTRKRRSIQPVENFRGILQDMALNNMSVIFNDNSSNIVRLSNTLLPTATKNVQSGAVKNDPCQLVKPCGNNSTCQYFEFEDYICNCTAGFTGKNCTDIDFCYYANCPNNTHCGNTEDGYECYVTATFNITSSVLYEPTPYINDPQNFSVHFRTREEQGYLFSAIDTTTNSNFSVYLHNNILKINAGNISGDASENVTDGDWHFLVLAWNENNTWITIDGVKVVSISNVSMNYTTLFTRNNFTVGEMFVGCMKNLSVNGKHLPLLLGTSNSSRSQQYRLLQETNIQLGCLSADVCLTNKCENQATCKDIWNKYKCNCVAGYTGEFCQQDIDECKSNPCMNGAACKDSLNSFTCDCVDGFEGLRCENNTDDCANNTVCINNGTCNDLVAGYNCTCTNEYTGDHCEFKINETCTKTNCKNGTCNYLNYTDNFGKTFEVFNCSCDQGFEGKECEIKTDFCENTTCSGRGNCSNNADLTGYVCNCTQGYEGIDCESKIDYCKGSPCKNGGTCKEKGFAYVCHCASGWNGQNCTEDINECGNRTEWCQNQGVCTNTPGSFICDCDGTGFGGYLCSEDIDECRDAEKNPCQHNSTCDNIVGSYFCDCIPELGFEGKSCDIPSCHNIHCHYGSECIVTDDAWFCLCPKYFEGVFCQCKGPCISEPCQNGTCIQDCTAQNYTCQCADGFEGRLCDQDIDECKMNPCQNGGSCKNNVGSYVCICPNNYLGNNCHLEDPCSKNPCQNKGNCSYQPSQDKTKPNFTCACFPGYSGSSCSAVVNNSETDYYIYIIIAVVLLVLVAIIAVTYFLITTRKKRATSGTYSPSRQEMSGTRVELGNVWKLPPTERLI
ncbi:protein crumbs isoform X1 [Octopus bimaculoides]|nr:protein crumbs isoform X1 [Octopus bimaculoides]